MGFRVLILDNVLASCSQVLTLNPHVQETLLLPMAYLLMRCKRKVFEIYEKGKSNDTTINPDDDGDYYTLSVQNGQQSLQPWKFPKF